MADRLGAAERALVAHAAFDNRDGTVVAASTPFEAAVRLDATGDAVRYTVRVELPTLDSVVVDEPVARVVQDGWFETLDRRLAGMDGALRAAVEQPAVELDDGTETVVVTVSFETGRPAHGAEDAAAAVGYVEGTYLEGVIPGYTYREPVAELLEQAQERSGASTD